MQSKSCPDQTLPPLRSNGSVQLVRPVRLVRRNLTFSRICASVSLCLLFSFAALAQAPAASTPETQQYDFANGLFHRGFFSEATQEYQKFLKDFPASPQHAEAQSRLGEAAYASGDFKAALDAFSALAATTDLDPGLKSKAQLNKGECHYHLKQYPEAITQLSPLTEEDLPQEIRARALFYAGQSHQAADHADDALTTYAKLIAAYPKDPLAAFARYQSGILLMLLASYEDAATALSAVANDPDADPTLRIDSRYRVAEVYDKMRWHEAAIAAYEALRKDYPDSEYAKKAVYGYAWALFNAGRAADALAAAKQFLLDSPDSPLAPGINYLIANCHEKQGDLDAALAAYTKIAEDKTNSSFAQRASYKRAWVLHLKGDNDAAATEAKAIVESGGEDALIGDATYLLGVLAEEKGDYETAQKYFASVVKDHPDSPSYRDAQFKSAECLAQLGANDEAVKAFDTFVEWHPELPLAQKAKVLSGDALFKAQSWAEALKRYQSATADADLHYRIAITQHNMKDYAASAASFQAMLDLTPADADPKLAEKRAEALYRIGDYQLHEGNDPLKAIEAFEKAKEAATNSNVIPANAGIQNSQDQSLEALDSRVRGNDAGASAASPFLPLSLRGLALAHYEQKDFDTAATLFSDLIRDYPDTPLNEATYTWLAGYLTEKEQWDAAIAAWNALLKNVPAYLFPEDAQLKIALLHEKAARPEEATKIYEALRKDHPESTAATEAVFQLAAMQEKNGKSEAAIALYEGATSSAKPEIASRAAFRLGELYEAKGDAEAAARNYMRVAVLYLDEALSPEALLRAGNNYAKLGNKDQAQKTWNEILTDYPQSAQATSAKEKLEGAGGAEK